MFAGKTQVPSQDVALARRDRLLSALKQGIHRKCSVVHAPTGYGKSTLLAQFHQDLISDGAQVAWLNLDESDASPEQFARSLARAWPGGREDTEDLDRLSAMQESGRDRLVAQALCSRCHPADKRAVIILDNFQWADGLRLRHFVATLIDCLPPTLHLVMATRRIPQLPIARLRAQGQINELGMGELRLSNEEFRKLLPNVDDVALANSELEGWPIAVQLLALALRDGEQVVNAGELLERALADIGNFIETDVLVDVPEAAQHLLLETATVDELHPELANVLCRRSDCGSLLRELSEVSLCVALTSASSVKFRQHRVISRYWRSQLLALRGEAGVKDQHQRAAAWLLEHGHIRAAASHLAQMGDFEAVARVIEDRGAVRIALVHGFPELASLIALLPTEVLSRYPRLLIARAWVSAKAGDTREARHWYEQVGRGAETLPPSDPLHSEALFVDKMIWTVFEQHPIGSTEFQHMEEQLSHAPSDDPWFTGWVNNLLCIMHTRRGELGRAEAAARQALENYGRARSVYGEVFMHLHIALLGVIGGRLTDAATAAEYSFSLATKHFPDDDGLLGIVDFLRGRIAYERHDLEKARSLLQPAMAKVQRAETWVEVYALGTSALARLVAAAGDINGALAYLDATRAAGISRGMPRLIWSAECCHAELLMLAHQLDAPRESMQPADSLLQGSGADFMTWFEHDRATIARFRLTLGQQQGSVEEVELFAADAHRQGRNAVVVEAQILIARHYFLIGRTEDAGRAFLEAVKLAAPEQMLRPFIEDAEAMAPIVRNLVRNVGICAIDSRVLTFIMEILSRLSPMPFGRSSASAVFTEKELEVLALLFDNHPNKIIARRLKVSEATVKFHLINIYRKLGVSRRSEAKAIAREHHLVIPGTH